MNPKILIVGTGALATLFANKLSAAGISISILGTWREGLNVLQEDGAQLDNGSKQPVIATNNPADLKDVKYALILVKAWQTERAAIQLKDCLAKDGLVLTLQNGLKNDEILSEQLGEAQVARGVTTLGATLQAPGKVTSSGKGEIVIERHTRLEFLEECLIKSNFEVKLVNDAKPAIWGKLMVNSAINPLTALLKIKNGEILNNQDANMLMQELACETVSVANASGVQLLIPNPAKTIEEVARQTADNISSMLQDVLRGSPTEIDAINGAICREGQSKGVATPVNKVMWQLIKAISGHGKITSFSPIGGT